jgi:hypothetical protein
MIAPSLPPLEEWANFYVIIGSSAAALTGLMFVVVALSAERGIAAADGLKAFATPTVVHFCSVLLLAAFVSTPGQTAFSLALCVVAAGVVGLAYTSTVIVHARRQNSYEPDLEDWTWYGAMPVFSYTILFVAGLVMLRRPQMALYLVAVTALLLLYAGIHNAWDSAVWLAMPMDRRVNAIRPPVSEDVSAAESRPTTSTDSASSAADAPSSETYR